MKNVIRDKTSIMTTRLSKRDTRRVHQAVLRRYPLATDITVDKGYCTVKCTLPGYTYPTILGWEEL